MKSAPLSSKPNSPGVFVLTVFTLCFSACAPVQPWERGRLAQPQMALEPDALMALIDDHTYTSKEAASGGIGPAGGGCGCN
jgi:hypothetical protein